MIRDPAILPVNVLLDSQRELAVPSWAELGTGAAEAQGNQDETAPVAGAPVIAECLGWVE